MPRDPEPVERVRDARAEAELHVAALQDKRKGVVERLRAVHPGILIGASVLAGFVLAGLLGGRRGRRAASAVKRFAPMAAVIGYVQTHLWSTAAAAARDWWTARAKRAQARAAESTADAAEKAADAAQDAAAANPSA